MKTYTLHLPAELVRGDPRALDRAVLVRDGFCWSAFAFTVLWFLRHRLWIAALIVGALLVALAFAVRSIGLPPGAAFLVMTLAAFLVGLESSSLRRWTYARGGRPARDAVIAGSHDEAEAKAFARWLEPAVTPRAMVTQSAQGRQASEVIGLFPATEGIR